VLPVAKDILCCGLSTIRLCGQRKAFGGISMPGGPKGEKRSTDAVGNAVMIAKIATGEIEDTTTEDGKNAAAAALGKGAGRQYDQLGDEKRSPRRLQSIPTAEAPPTAAVSAALW
jgi:hypothetical protein